MRMRKFTNMKRSSTLVLQAGVVLVGVGALALIGFVAAGEVFIISGGSDDRAGGVFMGLLIAFGSGVVAAAAAWLERGLRKVGDSR